ncbi:IBR finger domain protein [Fusarium subglutinans]|uniref:RBR-type E3 ubiquitin transferase n=1 Tax=Gibberella subglutinans TaxID=42677 RepID=A0A8H5Q9Y7_GIBSU|nr:IBR finger domain protein [Fusarium subglutinans]KAF5611595.1 IBR finger domain protein [Fusarium subglutinans]
MDARQEYNENASFEEAVSAIVFKRRSEPEHEMDTGDEGNEYMSDVLEDLSDGKSDSQPEEDSEESDDQDDEMSIDDEVEEISEGPSDSEQGEEIEQQGLHPAVPQGPTTQEPVQTEDKCLKFIPPNNTSDDGTPCYGEEAGCPVCNEITCTRCKNKGHTGDCEQQVGPAQALVLAETKGWKRCLRCGHLIELADGCSHMICVCGYEFCYECGEGIGDCQPISGVQGNAPKTQSETAWVRSDDETYMINVKSVFDPDSDTAPVVSS